MVSWEEPGIPEADCIDILPSTEGKEAAIMKNIFKKENPLYTPKYYKREKCTCGSKLYSARCSTNYHKYWMCKKCKKITLRGYDSRPLLVSPDMIHVKEEESNV